MTTVSTQNSAIGVYEPSCTIQFLPRCCVCGHKHPRAYMPPLTTDDCPACGAPAAWAGDPVNVDSRITDWRARFGSTLMAIGAMLHRFSNKV